MLFYHYYISCYPGCLEILLVFIQTILYDLSYGLLTSVVNVQHFGNDRIQMDTHIHAFFDVQTI